MFEGVSKQYTIVRSVEDINSMLNHISSYDLIAFDTEDTGVNTRKDKVIGFSLCGKVGESYYFPFLKYNPELDRLEELQIAGRGGREIAIRLLKELLGKKLVMHNGSYDCRIVKKDLGVDLLPHLYCDTIMLVHTCQEEGVGRGGAETFGLKKIAIAVQQEIGLDVEKAANEEQIELWESIKKNGGSTSHANYEIYKADLDILGKYAAADTDLTLRIFHLYSQKLKEDGLEKFFYVDEVMPVYREVTVPMEEHGVAVDIPLLERSKKEILQDMEKYKNEVISTLLKDEPGQRWVIDQALKTFPCKKTGAWGRMFIERHALPLPKTSRGYSTSKAAVDNLDLPEDSLWQKEFLKTGDESLVPEEERLRISLQLWKDSNGGDYFNVQSASQLADMLFNKQYYGEEPIKTNEETGKDSFDGLVIQEMSKKHPWCEKLRIYRKLQKIYTTYIDRFLNRSEDGVYYPYWKQNGTVSGRFASDLQQLPKPMEDDQDVEIVVRYNHLVRQFIIAGPGRKFVDADYESLEPHCFAFVSGDEGLRDIFRHGWDFYSTIALKTEKLDEDKERFPNGVSADKKSPVFLKKLDPVARQKAKGYALGVPYGMTGFALGKRLGIPTKEGQKLVEGYLDGFPQLKEWYYNTHETMYRTGKIVNYVGRIRHLLRGKEIYDAFGEAILEAPFRASLVNKLADTGMSRADAEKEVLKIYMDFKNCRNNAKNYQLQSLGADIVNRAALAITRKLRELNIDGYVCAQIHDQLVVNIEEGRAEEFRPWMEKLMAETTILPGVDLVAPAEVGNNMAETH